MGGSRWDNATAAAGCVDQVIMIKPHQIEIQSFGTAGKLSIPVLVADGARERGARTHSHQAAAPQLPLSVCM